MMRALVIAEVASTCACFAEQCSAQRTPQAIESSELYRAARPARPSHGDRHAVWQGKIVDSLYLSTYTAGWTEHHRSDSAFMSPKYVILFILLEFEK